MEGKAVILYDNNKQLIAISDKTLELLGFDSLEEFRSKVNDVAQLFLKRPGYVHDFKSFHWIDYCLTNSTVTHRAIIATKNGSELEVFINISPLNGLFTKTFYLVTLEPNTFEECFAPAFVSKSDTPPQQTQPQKERSSEVTIEKKSFPKLNLQQISEELNLSEDIVLDFIKEFVNHAAEKVPQVNEALKKQDIKSLKNIIHTLRGVSANLRLKPAVEILAKSHGTEEIQKLTQILQEFYSYILFLADETGVQIKENIILYNPHQQPTSSKTEPVSHPKNEKTIEPHKVEEASKELGLSFEEYQNYLKELINEIKINLAYNNYTELHKLASFARNLYLQECAKYLDEVSVNQNPELVKQCLRDLEELKKEPNPFLISVDDLKEALDLVQIDKDNFIEILEDLVIELKTLRSIKMKKEKFLKKAKQLKSLAESMRLSNLVLLLNNLITNYPLDKHLASQLDESIKSLEVAIKDFQNQRN